MSKRFRTSMMHQAGTDPALVIAGRVVNINLNNWTVDIAATFDRKRYFDIQISSPYLHYSAGEGLSIFPDIGAQCMVCVPGDSSPPFVLCFVMPHETVNSSSSDAPSGTRSHGNTPANPSDASFAGGRPVPKPGDIYLKGRDGNFVILHRGGVLQIGSSELAQRIYIPLSNIVTDMTGTYNHFNTGGAQSWGIQEGNPNSLPAQHLEVYRVFAGNQYADIKIAKGNPFSTMPDPDGGTFASSAGLGQGKNNEILFEIAVSPNGFVIPTGEASGPDVAKNSVLHFMFDQEGNTVSRIEGKFAMHVSQPVTLDFGDTFTVTSAKSMSFTAQNGIDIDGGDYVSIKGKVVLLGPGKQPVAGLGDATTSYIGPTPMPCVITLVTPAATASSSGPGTVTPGVPIMATIVIGSLAQALPIGGQISTAEYTVKS
jgi:hypothetical protein